MCRADGEWRLALENMKFYEVVEQGPFQVGGFQWMLGARLRGGIDDRTVLEYFLVSLNAKAVYARYLFSANCENEATSSQRTSRAVCPYGCMAMASIKLPIHLVNRHDGGPPLSGKVKVNFSIKAVRAATPDEENNISTSMTPVKLEVFDSKAIEAYVDDHTYGVVPERSERKIFVWHGSLIRFWAKSNPEYRYHTCHRTCDGDLSLSCNV